jgi:transcriptional regulator with XRE-family HTH domain
LENGQDDFGASDRSPGGSMLRTLRRAAMRTQLWVELEADLGTGYLQRIEHGKIGNPERETIERILTALDARFGERREVLERFGYAVRVLPPSAADRDWARSSCLHELNELPFPAYAIDCVFRVVAWNCQLARLFGAGDALLESFRERSVLEGWFDPTSPIGRTVAEPEQFLPRMLRTARFEGEQLGNPDWYGEILADLARRYPRIQAAADAIARDALRVSSARTLVPVRLIPAESPVCTFRLSAEPFLRDARFRLVYFLPADEAALRWCER